MKRLMMLLGFGTGVVIAGCLGGGGTTVIYEYCGDPGPYEFILAGDFKVRTQGSDTTDAPIPWATPADKSLHVDDAIDTLKVRYERSDGASVVETWSITNKRSTEDPE